MLLSVRRRSRNNNNNGDYDNVRVRACVINRFLTPLLGVLLEECAFVFRTDLGPLPLSSNRLLIYDRRRRRRRRLISYTRTRYGIKHGRSRTTIIIIINTRRSHTRRLIVVAQSSCTRGLARAVQWTTAIDNRPRWLGGPCFRRGGNGKAVSVVSFGPFSTTDGCRPK